MFYEDDTKYRYQVIRGVYYMCPNYANNGLKRSNYQISIDKRTKVQLKS